MVKGLPLGLEDPGGRARFQPLGRPAAALVSLTTTTTGGGLDAFNNLRPGNYRVTFGSLPGYVYTVQDSPQGNDATDSDADRATGQLIVFPLGIGQSDSTRDAGLYRPNTVGDRVWYDSNGDGIQDPGETGIPATVTIVAAGPDGVLGNADDVTLPSVTTGANGIWSVPNVPPGTCARRFSNLPNGLTVPTLDADWHGTPNTADFVGVSGVNRTDLDFGYRGIGAINGNVWVDVNRDGDNAGEPGIANVTVTAIWAGFDGIAATGDEQTYTTTTDTAGNYSFAKCRSVAIRSPSNRRRFRPDSARPTTSTADSSILMVPRASRSPRQCRRRRTPTSVTRELIPSATGSGKITTATVCRTRKNREIPASP